MTDKAKYLIIGALVGGGIVFSTSLFSSEKGQENEVVTETEIPSNNGRITGYTAPESITFAGEKVPLERQDVLERLEREVMVNAFWHSNCFKTLRYWSNLQE